MDCHSSIHQKIFNWDTHLLSKREFHWSNISKRKQQCFMAFFLCKIFLEYPFSSLKKWEKYWIMNWNWNPPKNYRHPNVSADERGKLDYLTSKFSGGLLVVPSHKILPYLGWIGCVCQVLSPWWLKIFFHT